MKRRRVNRIFGVGLSKTGTSSLATALMHLGFKTAHNPTDDDTLLSLLTGDLYCRAIRDHDAICDIMFCKHFRVLDRLYPESLFILTERDRERWHISCEQHWAARRIDRNRLFNEDLVDFQVYGKALYRRCLFEDVYSAHYSSVIDHFRDRPHQLLRINICAGEGWDSLCRSLNVPIPPIPFPNVKPAPWSPMMSCGNS